jgi:L-amino acid N-acyltransferase YncA
MEKKSLLQDGDYSIWRHNGIPNDALVFLDSIAWGNDGAVYEHKNTKDHIRLLHRPTLIAIHKKEKIQGTAVFCNTPVSAGTAVYNCYYIRYFAASNEIKGKGVMKKYAVKVMESVREDEHEKTVFFACIERGNKASYKTVQNAGYKEIGVIKTNGFSRFFPKNNIDIEQVKTDPVRNELLTLISNQYKQHALVQFNSLFLNDNYFVIREKGAIVAGCQFHRVHWVINRMPGIMGKLIMNVVPIVPLLNKLFNPKRFEFLAFEGIYVKPGYEAKLSGLFEGLLAQEKLKSAMYWMAENCTVLKRMNEHISPGVLHSFIKDADVFILASFHALSETEIADILSRPLFASAFDYI